MFNQRFYLIGSLIWAVASGGVYANEAIVRIDGSSTVYPITEAVAEEYQQARGTKVTVGISGTGGGFKKFCRGEIDIQNASRPILQKELDACQASGIRFIELPIAYDGLTVVVNKSNTFVPSLSIETLKKIWEPSAQGKIKTWKQVNSQFPDTSLRLFGAGADSGTFDFFTEAVVGKAKSSRGDYTASEDDNVLVNGVAHDKGALGYFGFGYFSENQDKLRAIAIANKEGKPVMPSLENIKNGSYPLSRPLFIYVSYQAATKKPEVKALVDFYLAQSKKLVAEARYIPLTDAEYQAVSQHWKALKVGSAFKGVSEVGLSVNDLLQRIK